MITNDKELKQILLDAKTIVVIGCSKNPGKAAYEIPKRIQQVGYRIIPVNPFADEIFGEKCYKKVSDIKEEVDIINIFRPSEETPKIVQESLKINPKVIWMQSGIESYEAENIAEKNNLKIVMNRCIMVEYDRLLRF